MADKFKACSVDGCNNNAARSSYGRSGYCSQHYRKRSGTPCSVEGCDSTSRGLGFCDKHYQRLRKYGDPLTIKATPKGEPQDFFLNVVLPYEGNECIYWPYSKNDGYAVMNKDGKNVLVCRFLCEMASGHDGDGYHAAHSCGNGMSGCVTKRHVSWKTPAQNMAEKFAHGTVLQGENNPPAKLTNNQVLEIFSLRGTESHSKLARRFGVSKTTIGNIMIGDRWGSVTGVKRQLPIATS